jgi:hypothetical protein
MEIHAKGTSEKMFPSVVFLHDQEPSAALQEALDRIRSNPDVSFAQVSANVATCECFQRIRVPALLLYNAEGVETAAAVGTESIMSLIEHQF